MGYPLPTTRAASFTGPVSAAFDETNLAVVDAGRRVASQDALGIARVSWANCSAVASRGLILGSSTFAGTGADAGKSMIELFGAGLQAAYPLDSGTHPALFTQTLAQAAASSPTAPGIHVVNAAVGGVNSGNVLTTTSKNQVISYAPHWILHSYWANDASSGGINAAGTKANVSGWISQIDAGYAAGVKPAHGLVVPHARGDAAWINGAAAMSESIESYRRVIYEIADEAPNKNVFVIDQGRAFASVGFVGSLNVDPRSMMDPASPTYVHLNNKGHRFGADNLRREIIGR